MGRESGSVSHTSTIIFCLLVCWFACCCIVLFCIVLYGWPPVCCSQADLLVGFCSLLKGQDLTYSTYRDYQDNTTTAQTTRREKRKEDTTTQNAHIQVNAKYIHIITFLSQHSHTDHTRCYTAYPMHVIQYNPHIDR